MNRRWFLQRATAAGVSVSAAAAAAGLTGCARNALAQRSASLQGSESLKSPVSMSLEALLTDTQRRTFNYFWQTTDAARGLAPDLGPEPAPASIAAMGFAFTAVPIGIEHSWITRVDAAQRVRRWLQFLWDAPQGIQAKGMSGYHGFFYHFLEMETGTRFRDSELSTVDTALLLMGVRFCGQYFTGTAPDEAAIRGLVDSLCDRVDWNWAQANGSGVTLGWRPETGFMAYDWVGYNEGMMIYLLALGSKTHPVGPEAWKVWTRGYDAAWGKIQGIEHLTFGPLFGHQFTQVWVNLRGIADAYMKARGLDYFENSRRAVLSQRAYAIANPLGWDGYGADVWGVSACDGPGTIALPYRGKIREFHDYAGRGVGVHPEENYDDGTLTPSAALGSLPFAPELATAATATMYRRFGAVIYGEYGFLDSFNPSFKYDVPLRSGRRVEDLGWVDTRYYGITQGPIVAMIENQRSGLIWRVMQGDPVIRSGLQRAGFTGGWLS